MQEDIPNVLLILGTDAAGKDHVAGIIEQMIIDTGLPVEKRKRYLSGKVTREKSSTGKSRVELFLEKCFILLLPYLGFLLPWVLHQMLRHDIKKYRPNSKKVVVVGHNCLRGLALYWGVRYPETDSIPIPPALVETLRGMRNLDGFHTLVLDVEDSVRQERISRREENGEADNFDRFMAEDAQRAERIEEILVKLSREYLGAQLIKNNDLPEQELRRLIADGFAVTVHQR